jgi:PAS domain S-box-containing protein
MDAPPPIDILVVEDDADARDNLRDILEIDEHRVATAGSAREVRARTDWPRFAAIILDRLLPDTTADRFLPELKTLAPGAAVIVITGYADIQGAIEALRQGATDYILKPINPDVLRTSLGRIAEQHRLALAKERSEATFRHLVEAAECLIVIVRPDHAIAYFSPFAERLTGYAAPEVQGRNYLELLVPEPERQAVAHEFEDVLEGRPARGLERRIVCRDGSSRWIAWNVRYLSDYEDGPAILAVGQDITFVKEAQARAVQAERLAAIGQMVTGLAHESRNALQRSQACLEMLTLVVRDQPQALDLIDRIQKAQDHLHHLFQDVRSYAAPIRLERTWCDLRSVWRDAWGQLESTCNDKQAILREFSNGVDLHCAADPFRMEQVFRNILDNALAAGTVPVVVDISAESATLEGRPALAIGVRDNGPGIGVEQRPKVFEPFFTTKAKGTGLGLAIARRIVEAHGGRITLADGEEPGAVFLVTLPKGSP